MKFTTLFVLFVLSYMSNFAQDISSKVNFSTKIVHIYVAQTEWGNKALFMNIGSLPTAYTPNQPFDIIKLDKMIQNECEKANQEGFQFNQLSIQNFTAIPEQLLTMHYTLIYTKQTPNEVFTQQLKDQIIQEVEKRNATMIEDSIAASNAKIIEILKDINDSCWNAELKEQIRTQVTATYVEDMTKLKDDLVKIINEKK